VIVRISHEGQYELDDSSTAALEELDHQAISACETADEGAFQTAFGRLLEFVRSNGTPVAADHLGGSDMILPPPDVSLEEATKEFSAEGLLPG